MSKWIVVRILPLVLAIACTKPNPNRCCTDEADCAAAELPAGSTCVAGLVCRGNQCIAEPCTVSSECEAGAPYCVAELCAEACSEDTQCPGFGQMANARFCEDGACHECRVDMNGDCTAALPVCDQGSCRACRVHSECASGICTSDGSCADPSTIAVVDPAGSPTSEYTEALACTLSRALSLTPVRRYILVRPGTYTSTNALLVTGGQRALIGGVPMPTLTRSTPGPIVSIDMGTDVLFENVRIAGATGNTQLQGWGIECVDPPVGPRTVRLVDVAIEQNASDGIFARTCAIHVLRSTFRDNGGDGLQLIDSNGTIDRTVITGNERGAVNFDSGLFTMTNSFVYRNKGGINFYSTIAGNKFEFNTIVDNTGDSVAGFACNSGNVPSSHPNNIIARNTPANTYSATCTFPSSIVEDDVSPLRFKSPDVPPYDYHLTAGSSAIDVATQSTLDHDFDGQPRSGPRDVGADEFVP